MLRSLGTGLLTRLWQPIGRIGCHSPPTCRLIVVLPLLFHFCSASRWWRTFTEQVDLVGGRDITWRSDRCAVDVALSRRTILSSRRYARHCCGAGQLQFRRMHLCIGLSACGYGLSRAPVITANENKCRHDKEKCAAHLPPPQCKCAEL